MKSRVRGRGDRTIGHPYRSISIRHESYTHGNEPEATPRQIAAGHLHNVRFREMEALVLAFGFQLARIEGSHHIYLHDSVSEQLNLQEVSGEAKPYQIRQFLRLVERYDLRMKEDS